MPLSSPTKSASRAAHDAKLQSQIADLTAQRDELLQRYKALMRDQTASSTPASHTGPLNPSPCTTTESTDSLTAPLSQSVPQPTQEEIQQTMAHANATLKRHIKLLHDYNEVKDVAEGLVGLVAEQRGERVKVVLEEMGVGEGD